jgi:hypothetical protein
MAKQLDMEARNVYWCCISGRPSFKVVTWKIERMLDLRVIDCEM